VPGEAFCDFCGSPLEAPVPTAEPTPELEPVSTEAELEAVPEPKAEAEAAPPVEEKPTCPACGAEVLPGEAFCANCGASLAQPPIPPEPVIEAEAEPEPPVEEAPLKPEPVAPEAPVAEAPVEAAPAEAVSETEPALEEAVLEPAVEAAPSPPPPTLLAAAPACPACGVEVVAGDRFCSNCGAVLEGAPASVEAVPAPPPPSIGPRLVVAASGAEIPLPVGDELLIGREDPVSGIFPDVDLTPHGGDEGGVSRQHARLIIEGSNYFVEDLDSTNFTFVNKQKLAPKTRQPLSDGDEIRCGRVALVLKT
jgi:hypothetical protein